MTRWRSVLGPRVLAGRLGFAIATVAALTVTVALTPAGAAEEDAEQRPAARGNPAEHGPSAERDAGTTPATPPPTRAPDRRERPAGEPAPLLSADDSDVVPSRYIVVMTDRARLAARETAVTAASARGARVHYRYGGPFSGFSATMSDAALRAVRTDPDVAYVEPVRIGSLDGTQVDAPVHLDRVDQRGNGLDGAYQSPNGGAGVTVYVVDQAIRASHSEFGGRVFLGRDFVGGAIPLSCMHHGTAVAGLVGGATYGTAKNVRIGSLRVTDCNDHFTSDTLVAAVNWLNEHAQRPAVVNMSLWIDGGTAVDAAIAASSTNYGITYVTSAGNKNLDACNQSPAVVTEAITVGAVTSSMARVLPTHTGGAWGSNWGRCVDVFAPGLSLRSAHEASDQATGSFSGTSASAPLVSGVAAMYLSRHPLARPEQVQAALVGTSTPGVVTGAGTGSPNRFLYANPLPVPRTSPNAGLTGMLAGQGDRAGCADWSVGDGTQSTPLPDGRRVWFFADSFLNSPSVRSTRPFDFSAVRNAIMVQDGSSMRTVTGGNTCREGNDSLPFWDRYADTSVEDPSQSSNAFYWPNEGTVVGSDIVRFYYRNVPTPDGWWTDTHTAIATIPISSLNSSSLKVHPTLMAPVYSYGQHPINWGAALLRDGGWVYIYGAGIANSLNERRLYLARTAAANLANPNAWQFNLGGGRDAWSAPGHQAAARPLHASLPIENGFAVAAVNGAYWLVQHEPNLNGGDIVAHPGSRPWNIGNRMLRLYTPPEGPRDAAHKFQFYYEVRLHQGLGSSSSLAISYNVNTTSVSIGCRSRLNHDPSTYRPRFLNVPTETLYLGNATATAATARRSAPLLVPRGIGRPGAGAASTSAARPEDSPTLVAADYGWYDQWASPQKENHGCPPLTRTTSLSATSGPDGVVSLRWDDYGRDMWYWVYSRDATLGQPFTKHELWATGTSITNGPITSAANNGHVFEYYVVPFAYGDPTDQDRAPASGVARTTVRVERPATPQDVRAGHHPVAGQLKVLWNPVTFPSSDIYYAISYWDESAGETEQDARRVTFIDSQHTSWVLSGLSPGHQYAFRVEASNLAGVSLPSNVGRGAAY